MRSLVAAVLLVSWISISSGRPGVTQNTEYVIGRGMADVTGPAAEINMMGYANPSQRSAGIHLRQYSRAFIIANPGSSSRVVYVSIDACMVSQLLKIQVVSQLKELYKGVYNETNVLLSGIHTHSGPGAFHQYVLFDITSLGFYKPSLDALVTGVVRSIQRAHESMVPGNIYINQGELLDTNINRSPTAYLNNPKEERQRYKYDVDKEMVLLKLVDANNKGLGMINWYPVHCTSMNNTNSLISSDNKGYAAIMFESDMNNGSLPGQGDFVAAFGQANEGDVSPNTKGPHCVDTGLPCDIPTSTCDGKVQKCIASGPGVDMVDSTRIIAQNQYKKALELYNNATIKLTGPVDFRFHFVNMTNVQVPINATYNATTCKPSMGYSFAAGTTDGPGAFDFKQGDTTGNEFWNTVRDFIKTPSKELVACHAPKPILLPTGEITFPYAWQPEIADFQLFRIGQLIIAAVPAEFTTMSGRRMKEDVKKNLVSLGFSNDTQVVIAGLSNTYADYVATYEEYQVQRYEGASTVYGPHTLQAMIIKMRELATAMAKNTTVPEGPHPPDLSDKLLSFVPPVIFDRAPIGKKYGDVTTQPKPQYLQGETVYVRFVSGNPRNNITGMLENTFITVEQQTSNGTWKIIATDSAWETTFAWKRRSTLLGTSEVTVTWSIPANQEEGVYRIQHFGYERDVLGKITPYSGATQTFKVVTWDHTFQPITSRPTTPPKSSLNRLWAWVTKTSDKVKLFFTMLRNSVVKPKYAEQEYHHRLEVH